MEKRTKINVYLDDKRDCPDGYVLARTMEEAVLLFEQHNVHILSLDHDLGEDEEKNLLKTGYDFVKYFCENGLESDQIFIHTDNGPGRANMYETLLGAQRRGFINSSIEIYYYSVTENKYSGD